MNPFFTESSIHSRLSMESSERLVRRRMKSHLRESGVLFFFESKTLVREVPREIRDYTGFLQCSGASAVLFLHHRIEFSMLTRMRTPVKQLRMRSWLIHLRTCGPLTHLRMRAVIQNTCACAGRQYTCACAEHQFNNASAHPSRSYRYMTITSIK